MTEASSLEDSMSVKSDDYPNGHSLSESEEPVEADMAQMMGFSSFSSKSKPLSKKRKRELAQLATSGPGMESGSGSNTMPLGKPRRKPVESEGVARGNREPGENTLNTEAVINERLTGSEKDTGQYGNVAPPSDLGEQAKPSSFSNKPHPSAGEDGYSQYDWHMLRKGVRDDRGDVAYYDARFVEDPWKNLI
ncbi:MAG: hypothetical protein Q9195_001872 [Heterodermia aff. obscurata]